MREMRSDILPECLGILETASGKNALQQLEIQQKPVES